MSSEAQFNQITEAVDENYVALVKDGLVQSKITDLKDFYDVYRQEQMALDKEFAQPPEATKAPASLNLELFADIFKYLDEFPNNLQKPKKLPPMRERLNSTLSKSSPSLNDLTSNQRNNTSATSLNAIKLEDVPKPTDTYRNFQKFQKQLKQLTQDISQQSVEEEYAQKLKQLHNFAQQLEKVLPTEEAAGAALTEDEEKVIEDLVKEMEDMYFIRDNQDIFRTYTGVNTNSKRMDILVDVLSLSLIAVNSMKISY